MKLYSNREYECFNSIDEAKLFESTFMGDWMLDYRVNGDLRYCSDVEDFKYNIINNVSDIGDTSSYDYYGKLYQLLQYYCGNGFRHINSMLRDMDKTSNPNRLQILKAKSIILDNEISKFTLEDNIIVYRIINQQDIKVNSTWTDKAFVSTSLVNGSVKQGAGVGGNTLLKLYVPAGIHAICLDSISNRDECEFLLQKDLNFKVVKKLYEDGYDYSFAVEVSTDSFDKYKSDLLKPKSVISKLMNLF